MTTNFKHLQDRKKYLVFSIYASFLQLVKKKHFEKADLAMRKLNEQSKV